MKHFTTTFLMIALVLSLGLIGCSGDDNPMNSNNNSQNPPSTQIPAEAVDIWVYNSATVNGSSMSLGSVLDWTSGAIAATFEVKADGSYIYFEFDSNFNVLWYDQGTVRISGSNITVTTTSENGSSVTPYSYSGTWSISGNTMILRLTLNGDSIVLTAVK